MNKLTILVAASATLLSACASTETAAPEAAAPAATAADQFIGKRLVGSDGTVFTFNDGVVGGVFRGEAEIVGEYRASATEICSTYTAPPQFVGLDICSVPMVDGDTVIFNRRDGSQSPPYTIMDG